MNYFKKSGFIVLLMFAFIRCTEIYTPDISSDTQALVVEALITDAAGPFTVKLSMAKPLPYDSVDVTRYEVRLAKVTIVDNFNKTFNLVELTPGNYVTPPNFITKIGNLYKLYIRTIDGNSYESNYEKLLPPQTYDNIHANYTKEDYVNDKNELLNVYGADIRVDLFSSLSESDVAQSCRFTPQITNQYWYTYRDRDLYGNEIMSYHWANFGWKTYKLNSTENITAENVASSNPLIENHSLGFIPFDMASYGLEIPPPIMLYYLRVNQYTMNNDSYSFYKGANNQLSASGKIFDPISSQLYGNLRCTNNTSKIVLGLFEVSSVIEHAFLIDVSYTDFKVSVKMATVMDVPDMPADNFWYYQYGDYQYQVWDDGGEAPTSKSYIPIPLPNWWYHN